MTNSMRSESKEQPASGRTMIDLLFGELDLEEMWNDRSAEPTAADPLHRAAMPS